MGAMSEARASHSAAGSAAGYLYQARLALVEALRYAYVDSAIEIAVEKFDDVSFERAAMRSNFCRPNITSSNPAS